MQKYFEHKLDNREDEHASEGGGETDKVSSHMTCHNIVHQNATFVKLVVYQKLEWWDLYLES